MEQPTKAVKRALRELAAVAHEEEMRRALLPVAAAFEQWHAGQLESGELADLIHRFHDGPARELYKRFTFQPDFAVAHSIAAGVIERDKVPPEVIEHCRCAIEFFAAALPGER